jgi:hypothetical protein
MADLKTSAPARPGIQRKAMTIDWDAEDAKALKRWGEVRQATDEFLIAMKRLEDAIGAPLPKSPSVTACWETIKDISIARFLYADCKITDIESGNLSHTKILGAPQEKARRFPEAPPFDDERFNRNWNETKA